MYLPVSENLLIHSINFFKRDSCHGSRIDEVRTKCFSRRLIRGVGNFSYTVSFSAMRISLKMYVIQSLVTTCMHACVLEVVVHSASHSVCLKSQVHILAVSMVDVILVQDIV